MATEHILTRGHDRIRVVHHLCDLITGEGEHAIVQSFDDEAAARSHLDYVLMRRRRDGYTLTSREVDEAGLDGGTSDQLFEWEPAHARLKCVFTDEAGVSARCEGLPAAASAREAVCLHFVCDPVSPGRALSSALERRPLPTVRRLIFDTPFQTVTRQRDNSPGRLDLVLTALPALERAFVTGAAELRRVGHSRLRALHLLGDPFPAASLAGLGDSDFPVLEQLVLCLARDDEPAPADQVAAVLHKLRAPGLRWLDVSGADDLVALVDALFARPLPARWSTVSLDGILRDEDDLLTVLADHADALRRLDHLALRLHDDLSEEAADRARELVPNLVDREQLPDLLQPAVYEDW